jgi:lipoprotein-anchoring transpeptidase ErfK/SrfK
MERVGTDRRRVFQRGRWLAAAAGGATLALLLSACTSSGSHSSGNGSAAAGPSSAAGGSSAAAPSASASEAAQPAVITTSAHGTISPAKPVTVSIRNGKLTSVTMVNPVGRKVHGAIAADGTSWRNTEDLGYSKTYRLLAKGVDASGKPVEKKAKVTTVTPDNLTMPYINTLYNSPVHDNGTYGVGMVVKVTFDESVDRAKAERALHVTTTPNVTGGWYWDDDQNAYWRPQSYYQPGTKVTVSAKVYGVEVGQGLYGQEDKSVSFKIGQKRLAIANNKTHKVKVYFGDKLVRTMPTSMGMGGSTKGKNGQTIYFWTMPGTYTVLGHENPATMSSDSYGLPKNSPYGYAPEKVYWSTKISTDGIYLHELDTTVWAQGHQNVSHGCLNLNHDNAKWYYQHSQVGDLVKVINSAGPHLQFWQGGQWDIPGSQWVKGSALH